MHLHFSAAITSLARFYFSLIADSPSKAGAALYATMLEIGFLIKASSSEDYDSSIIVSYLND
jgi:hypothetical protein